MSGGVNSRSYFKMIKPVVQKSLLNDLKLIDPGLFLVWCSDLERFQVLHKDLRTGLVRLICTVEDEQGNYQPFDQRVLNFLRDVVCWDLIKRFPSPKDLYEHMKEKQNFKKEKSRQERLQYLKDYNKAHRKEWMVALENAKKGIFGFPEIKKTKVFSAHGITPGQGTVILTDSMT